MVPDPPQFPIGSPPTTLESNQDFLNDSISTIAQLPVQLRELLDRVNGNQLDLLYRNWSIRQIVHHLADSHVNAYIRFKWTLTEDKPLIKAYHEGRWSDLDESKSGDVEPSLRMIDGLHERWVQLMRHMSWFDFERCYEHPESGDTVPLNFAVGYYAWHGRHHMGQIDWILQNRNG